MPDQLPEPIIERINNLIEDISVPREERAAWLEVATTEAWDYLLELPRVPLAERQRRWANVRQQLSSHPNGGKILKALDFPATGRGFGWIA